MRKKGLRKIQTAIKTGQVLLLSLAWVGLSGFLALAAASGPVKNPFQENPAGSETERLLYQAGRLDASAGREGAGTITWKTADEWLRLRFRLLARGPEALRLELFDPFGRPAAYFFSYQGRFFLVSNDQKKEIFPQAAREGPLSVFSETAPMDFLKVLWGRIPIIPHEKAVSEILSEKEPYLIKVDLEGLQKQWIWLSPDPFSVLKTRIQNRQTGSDWLIAFSDFITGSGGGVPKQVEIQDESGEKTLTLRYDTILPRQDIPETAFMAE
jgi:hypothetical protein